MNVLLVEDNRGDVRLMRDIFREVFTSINLYVANDGSAALSYEARGRECEVPRPDLISA